MEKVGNTDEAIQEFSGKSDYVLCPDVSAQDFEQWIKEVEGIVGKENVLVNLSSKIEDQAKSSYIHQPAFVDFLPIVSQREQWILRPPLFLAKHDLRDYSSSYY